MRRAALVTLGLALGLPLYLAAQAPGFSHHRLTPERNEARDRTTVPRDDDLITFCGLINQLRKTCLGLVDVYGLSHLV